MLKETQVIAVKMRAILIKPDLKPVSGLINMRVYDPENNLIAQWTNQTLDMGVLSKAFQV